MALFSDGPPSTVDDLTQQDSYLLAVAGTEGINVTTKLQLAYTEVQIELTAIFGREASIYAPVLGEAPLDTNHLSITPALMVWHTFKSLELVYRDAYFNQLNDRYKAKWVEFQDLSSWARGRFIDTGAGLVIDPLPQPGAPVTAFEPSSQAGGTTYIVLTFLNAESEESTPSVMTEIAVPDANVLSVGAPTWPTNATGWNLYGGPSPATMTLQNATPMTLGLTWHFVLPGSTTGALPGEGQSANVTRDLPRRIMRG